MKSMLNGNNNKMMASLLLVVAFLLMNVATAWLSTSSTRTPLATTMTRTSPTTALFYKNLEDDEEEEPTPPALFFQSLNNDEPPSVRRNRASLEGVSLAPTGFWVMLRMGSNEYLPWQVTDDPADAVSATSPEALTMIQLLSGVDMAGAILPPDVLAKLVLYHCEGLVKRHTNTAMFFAKQVTVAQQIVAAVQESLPNSTQTFAEAHSWAQSRAKLPEASLDEIVVSPSSSKNNGKFTLTCTIRNFGSLTFTPSQQSLEKVLYQYSPKTSLAFTSLALALRYKAPVTVETATTSTTTCNEEQLKTQFPLYATASTLQQSSHRVQQNIVRGFEIHKLSGALKIAMEKGDLKAAAKIRQALDEYDSMDELPTASLQEDGVLLPEQTDESLFDEEAIMGPSSPQQQQQQQQNREEITMFGKFIGDSLPQQNMTMSVLQ